MIYLENQELLNCRVLMAKVILRIDIPQVLLPELHLMIPQL